ncbi:glycoside hydrolase family 88/105 protein [Oleiharenicola lentus]|uniref:glycoside hydrolase family 88/105 protein n=1 Tax=Oleiharenicola lentus TaxID=2508720 RepID=UPI003F661F40
MRITAAFLSVMLGLASVAQAASTDKAAILEVMERAADWQIANPSVRWKPNLWHNAAFYSGVMALSRVSESPRFHDAMMKMGEANEWKPAARIYHADDHAVSQTYLELYALHNDSRMIAPTIERFDYILAHPKDDNLDFDKSRKDRNDRWSWCDSLFMAPPAWIGLWKATGEKKYLDFAIEKWWLASDFLYDKDEHLYFRDSTLFKEREPNGKKIFWGRGNGWVMGGLARVMDLLPKDHPARPRFEQQFREMAAAVLKTQQADGLWRASLLDADTYPMQETSGTAFFCYAFAWGINRGLLDRATYEQPARRAWDSVSIHVKSDGKLTHVQPVGFTPVTFDAEWTEPYGVGALLLAGSEMIKLNPAK